MNSNVIFLDQPGVVPCYVVVPGPECESRQSPFVTVHGISRNAQEHACSFSELARTLNRVVVAPLFRPSAGRHYQRIRTRRFDAAQALDALLAALREQFLIPEGPIDLFGFSGGAQFAHRYAMLNPSAVGSLMLASAGWYTTLRDDASFPFGIAEDTLEGRRIRENLAQFLRLPCSVWAGELDDARDSNLRRDAYLDSYQGLSRLERAARWVRMWWAMADEAGIDANVSFDVLKRCGHDFAQCVDEGRLPERIMAAMCESAEPGPRPSTHRGAHETISRLH